MEKIKMVTPLVEMDGDEMTRILWQMIKDQLILPFVDLKTEYYDLGLLHRNETQDQVTVDAANATRRLGVAVKCATITPNKQRMEEYPQLTQMWKSPNGTIRSILDGTVFRAPILIDSIHPVVKNWKKPITIARHAYGDVYKSVDLYTTEPGECTMTFKGQSGEEKTLLVQKVDGPAVWQGAHNKEKSIRSFARACFQYAIDTKQDLWFSTKDTIAKVYDGEFKKVFEEEFESYKAKFDELGITYFYTLIDDAVARVIRSQGGFIWACKNYDGDVMSDMVSTAFGSLAMMTSVLVSPDGTTEYEAAHGTVTKHYYKHLKGEQTSTNPMATIFAWSGALRKRGQLDGLTDLAAFADKLEAACFETLGDGIMTKGNRTLSNHGDLEIIGNQSPRYQYSINMSLNWNGIGLSMLWQGVGKRDWYPWTESGFFWGKWNRAYNSLMKTQTGDNVVRIDKSTDNWRVTNMDKNPYWTRMVSLAANRNDGPLTWENDHYLQDASYIRLKNITIDYTFPKQMLTKIGIQNLRIYLSGENLFTITPLKKYAKNYDPENIYAGDSDFSSTRGGDGSGDGDGYPVMKSYTIGLSITF